MIDRWQLVSRLAVALLVAAITALCSCKQEQQPEGAPPLPQGAKLKESSEKAREIAKSKKIAVVPKGTAHTFWLAVKAGAEAACEEYGAEPPLWQGPESETQVDRQIEIIENYITQGVDAIVMAACDTKALIPVLKKAKEAGIAVVTIDSGIDDDTVPASFVATDNAAAAAKAAEVMAELLGEEGGLVGIIPFDPNAQSSQDRERGFEDRIKSFPSITLGPKLYSKSDPTEAVTATENMLSAEPNLAGIFAANEPGGVGAAETLKKRGRAGDVKLVAFDASEAEVQHLKDGAIQALIVQDPFKMGHDGVECALKVLAGETVPNRIETEVVVVTKDNIDDPEVQKVLYPTK